MEPHRSIDTSLYDSISYRTSLETHLEHSLEDLSSHMKRHARIYASPSSMMIEECQHLLKLFGIPYVTGPMEAEAQCAYLEQCGLVEGIVTDDSDIFLFGGSSVYRNMFRANKYIEWFKMSDIQRELKLDRSRLIQLAHLLGCDYTDGVHGVGTILAMEILHEFPDLIAFREWLEQHQHSQNDNETTSSSIRCRIRKQVHVAPTFPDRKVDHAYLHPTVNENLTPFTWALPDLDSLRDYIHLKLSWERQKVDDILLPVLRSLRSPWVSYHSNIFVLY
jgi:DNA excision repair protein ERCC-5